jgi:hypothetical protein
MEIYKSFVFQLWEKKIFNTTPRKSCQGAHEEDVIACHFLSILSIMQIEQFCDRHMTLGNVFIG